MRRLGDGTLSVNGTVAGVFGASYIRFGTGRQRGSPPIADALARHAKKDIPDDLVASGKLNGSVKVQRKDAGYAEWNGSGESLGVRIGSKSTRQKWCWIGSLSSLAKT